MRIDKFVADNTAYTRQQARRVIRRGRVCADNERIVDPSRHITSNAKISVDGELIHAMGLHYWMVHKPAGYVSATKDAQHPVVSELLPVAVPDIHIAGRLDRDVTGLVLLTNDGAWSHRLTSPRHHCLKRYKVETIEPVPHTAVEAFAQGVRLHNESRDTKPARLEINGVRQATLWLSEGRFHQVKRMFLSQGCKVARLHRDQIGSIQLDIPIGTARALSQHEIATINTADSVDSPAKTAN